MADMADISALARTAFAASYSTAPPMSLRGGNAVDEYKTPPPFDPTVDEPTDEYLEDHYWGMAYLDAASWKHYLPRLIDYALRHKNDAGAMPVDALLASLRPPDRDPPRLATLSRDEEEVVVALLDVLAFDEQSAWKEMATQVMEEYWVTDALYRK